MEVTRINARLLILRVLTRAIHSSLFAAILRIEDLTYQLLLVDYLKLFELLLILNFHLLPIFQAWFFLLRLSVLSWRLLTGWLILVVGIWGTVGSPRCILRVSTVYLQIDLHCICLSWNFMYWWNWALIHCFIQRPQGCHRVSLSLLLAYVSGGFGCNCLQLEYWGWFM